MPQAPCGAGLRLLTPTRQWTTILYRLVGGTLARPWNFQRRRRSVDYVVIPVESLPIPYSITDVGRAFLAQCAAMELAAAADSASPPNSGTRLPPQPLRHSY